MTIQEKPVMPPFAAYLCSPQVWIGEALTEEFGGSRELIVWKSVGPHKVPIYGRHDGFIVFEFDATQKYRGGRVPAYDMISGHTIPKSIINAEKVRNELAYRRFDYMNAFMQAFSSGMSIIQKHNGGVQTPLDPSNHFKCVRKYTENQKLSWDVFGRSNDGFEYLAPRSLRIKPETLNYAIDVMSKCDDTFGETGTGLLSLTYIACHQYTLHQFASAHLIAWCVVEKLLNNMWSNLLNEVTRDDEAGTGHTKFNNSRRDLLNGRDYTASVKSQVLSIANKIDDALLERLNIARKVRNDFAHSLKNITSKDSAVAIRLATDLMSHLINYSVTSQLSTSYWD